MSLDLGYFNRSDRWDEGWRPDDFFALPQEQRELIEKIVEHPSRYQAAKLLIAALNQEQHSEHRPSPPATPPA
jgi:hypothetical protein